MRWIFFGAFLAAVGWAGPLWADDCLATFPRSFRPTAIWVECLDAAVDSFYDQPEPVDTVVTAAYATCLSEEIAYRKAAGGGSCGTSWADAAKQVLLTPHVIARVMADRAARARVR